MTNTFIPMNEVDMTEVPEGVTLLCSWFKRCEREAVGVMTHPILGGVFICEPCAKRLEAEA